LGFISLAGYSEYRTYQSKIAHAEWVKANPELAKLEYDRYDINSPANQAAIAKIKQENQHVSKAAD
jgi:hypothetical protein